MSSIRSGMPFSGAVPIRLVGASSSFPFCSIVSEGKLIYSSGSHLVLENTKTHEQKIIYTHTLSGKTSFIVHHTTLYNEHFLALCLRENQSFMQVVVIVPLSTALFSLEESENHCKIHYLKHLQDSEKVEGLQFFEEGSLYGVVSKNQQITNFSLMKASNGDLLFRDSYLHTSLLLSSTSLGKQNYISLLLLDKRDGTRLCLMASDELSRRLYFCLNLEKEESIIQYSFEPSHEQSVLLISLTSLGFIVIFKVNELEVALQARIDAKVQGPQDKLLITSLNHIMPCSIQTAGNRIVVAYNESKMITLFQFSSFDPSKCTVLPLREALENFSQITATHSIKLSRDGCSLAALFMVSSQACHRQLMKTTPFTTKTIPPPSQPPHSYTQLTQTATPDVSSSKDISPSQGHHFVALQIDLLSNIIDHSHKKLSVGNTLSVCAGQAQVKKVEYCAQSNTMFVLLGNKTIKYYDLTPGPNSRGKPEYRPETLQLWTCALSDQPISFTAHPFNFSLLLLYEDIVKIHNYNCKCLFPAFIVSSLQYTSLAVFSPLGDKIVLAAGASLIVLDAYTYRTIRQVALPNLQPQQGLSSPSSSEPKTINDLYFVDNEQMMVLSGHNTLSMVYGLEKATHFGFLQQNGRGRYRMAFDRLNQLASVVEQEQLLVLSKASLGSNKCNVVNKIQLQVSSLLEVAQLGVFFIGGRDGCLYMLRWPHYSQQELYLTHSHRIMLFDQPIVSIHATPSFKYLYAISEQGALAILELKVGEGEDIPKQYKQILLKLSDLPLNQNQRWLISRGEEEKKERELIKLRGEQADTANNHAYLGKEQHFIKENMITLKRGELQESYLEDLKSYEEHLGLQKVVQQISLLKDEFKLIRRRRERELSQFNQINNKELHTFFQQRGKLELSLIKSKEQLAFQQQALQEELKNQLDFLIDDFKQQNSAFLEKKKEACLKDREDIEFMRFQEGETEEVKQQTLQLVRSEFETEIQKLMEVGQGILSKNRSTHISSYRLQDKISEVGIEREKVEFDLTNINSEKDELLRLQGQLQESLESTGHNYNRLMKQTRELEEELLKERRIASRLHCDLTSLTQDLTVLEEREKELAGTYQQLNDQFIGQKEKYFQNSQAIKSMTQKIDSLKNLKKEKCYQSSLKKSQLQQALRTIFRELEADEEDAVAKIKNEMRHRHEMTKQNEMSVFFQQQREGLDKMSRNAIKWKSLKETYFGGFRRNYHKLNDQNIKLTYQYNDLFKVAQEYRTQLGDLQDKIDITKKKREQSISFLYSRDCDSGAKIRCSMFGKPKNLVKKELIKKKGVCVSLHQETGKFITQA